MRVELKAGDKLTWTVPDQPPYELLPAGGLTFNMKGLAGYTVEFRADAAGRIADVVAYQPNGTFVAKRK